MQRISDYELELMKIIWSNGGAAVYSEIARALEAREAVWTKNTIVTLLSRLAGKGYLETKKINLRRNRYIALISEAAYQAAQTESFLSRVYEGNAKGLVATLIRQDMLSPQDYEDLKKHWEAGR